MVSFEEGSLELVDGLGKGEPIGWGGQRKIMLDVPSLLSFYFIFVFSCFRYCWLVGLGTGVGGFVFGSILNTSPKFIS